MKQSALLCAESEYDDELFDWDKTAGQLGKFWPPKSVRGSTATGMMSLEHGARLVMADECRRAGDSDPQDCITLEILQTPFGTRWVEARRPDGSTAIFWVGKARRSRAVPNLRRTPYRVTKKVLGH